MFNIKQIKDAHSRVKSGADFPSYIQDLKELGVTYYETFVKDGHTEFEGSNNFKTRSDAKYSELMISEHSDQTQFQNDLKVHQQGKTNFLTFCEDCAKSGIEKWAVDLHNMTCTYFDKAGNKVLVENIPGTES